MKIIKHISLLILVLTSNVLIGQQEKISSKKTLKTLFVGNSLTYTNNLPKLVSEIAFDQGDVIKTNMIARPNYALIDHLDDGEVQKLIANSNFDFVIIQQGPSSQTEGRRMLLEDGATIKKLCKDNGATLVYFMVWPSRQYYYTYNDVITNHIDAATANDALLAPVGAIWKVHFDQTNDFSYYGNDGFHPSLIGSKVAAKVIAAAILNEPKLHGGKN